MTRLIDADALINDIKHGLWDWQTIDGTTATSVLKQTITDIENQPTVDAVPVRHGKWIKRNAGHIFPHWASGVCSECGYPSDETPYCASCGAKMDGEGNG